MKYWLIADTHFGHTNVIEYCGRPENYEDRLSHSLSQIPENDTLIHLGDICIGNDAKHHEKYIQTLQCRKILVKGNHDRKSTNWYSEHGWDFVCDTFTLKAFGQTLIFSHIQINDPQGLNIHGHSHNTMHHERDLISHKYSERHILIKCEHTYRPIRLDKLMGKSN